MEVPLGQLAVTFAACSHATTRLGDDSADSAEMVQWWHWIFECKQVNCQVEMLEIKASSATPASLWNVACRLWQATNLRINCSSSAMLHKLMNKTWYFQNQLCLNKYFQNQLCLNNDLQPFSWKTSKNIFSQRTFTLIEKRAFREKRSFVETA